MDLTKSMDAVVESVRGYVQRATSSIGRRLDALEARGERVDSFERRLSRHADHLAALESRLKRLEHGGDK